jgi:hypothetical protein
VSFRDSPKKSSISCTSSCFVLRSLSSFYTDTGFTVPSQILRCQSVQSSSRSSNFASVEELGQSIARAEAAEDTTSLTFGTRPAIGSLDCHFGRLHAQAAPLASPY